MSIAIEHLYNTNIKNRANAPKTYSELCDIIYNLTYFSKEHIMPILRDLDIYQEPDTLLAIP